MNANSKLHGLKGTDPNHNQNQNRMGRFHWRECAVQQVQQGEDHEALKEKSLVA
jgi:hypothetical protein